MKLKKLKKLSAGALSFSIKFNSIQLKSIKFYSIKLIKLKGEKVFGYLSESLKAIQYRKLKSKVGKMCCAFD